MQGNNIWVLWSNVFLMFLWPKNGQLCDELWDQCHHFVIFYQHKLIEKTPHKVFRHIYKIPVRNTPGIMCAGRGSVWDLDSRAGHWIWQFIMYCVICPGLVSRQCILFPLSKNHQSNNPKLSSQFMAIWWTLCRRTMCHLYWFDLFVTV